MKNKSGFTLIELLGVFALLGVISLVVVPYATGMLKKTKSDEKNRFNDTLFLATEAYIHSNEDSYQELQTNGSVVYVSLGELVANGFLSKNLTDPKTKSKIDLNQSIKVEKTESGLRYAIE